MGCKRAFFRNHANYFDGRAPSRDRRAPGFLPLDGKMVAAWSVHMRIIEIPRETWIDQLNAFTIAHDGWLASVDVFGGETGAQPEIVNMPLLGVSADRIDHDGTIAVSVARSAVEHFTHIVHGVTRIFFEQIDDGSTAALLVESADGTRTVMQLRAPASHRPGAPGPDPAVPSRVATE